MKKTDDGGPAFPRPSSENTGMTGMRQSDSAQEGLSLRDYFAAKAMQSLVAVAIVSPETAKKAYQMADWMLQTRDAE